MNLTPVAVPSSAPAIVASQQAKNFAALGATQVTVSDTGIQLNFANEPAARIARAVVQDAITVQGPNGRTAVPVRTGNVADASSVALADAGRAVKLLNGVVDAGRLTTGDVRVYTLGQAYTDALRALIGPTLVGVPVEILTYPGGGGTHWGAGVGAPF